VNNAIEAEGLKKTYGEVDALDGLSFAVPEGSVFGLLGPNGAGKSTAVKILTTLARPDSGAARVAGLDVLTEPGAVRRQIGVAAQKSGVDREATGRENLLLQGHVHGMRGAQLAARTDELLERFHLTDAANRIAKGYSGGMERRLDIAMALIQRPKVLFLDEPTTGLDPEVRAEMWKEIGRLAEDGLTVLLTTHYLEEADNLASQLAIVDRGKVVAEGSPEELKRDLKGDAIRVGIDPAANGQGAPAARDALGGIAGLRDVVVEGHELHARADEGAATVPAVLQALDHQGIPVTAVTVARPSLDDVYLRYTGRSFDNADTEEASR
jgi:ABC-2 type transport system ATP-binding protein